MLKPKYLPIALLVAGLVPKRPGWREPLAAKRKKNKCSGLDGLCDGVYLYPRSFAG
jgi:hypothetical protein